MEDDSDDDWAFFESSQTKKRKAQNRRRWFVNLAIVFEDFYKMFEPHLILNTFLYVWSYHNYEVNIYLLKHAHYKNIFAIFTK
jgi:hypothetical protein